MRNYIYKILIAAVAFILVFEFTIGRKFNQINEKTEIIFTKEGRKEMVISLKNEMKKAIEKENYLDEEERVLINKFIEKIRNELFASVKFVSEVISVKKDKDDKIIEGNPNKIKQVIDYWKFTRNILKKGPNWYLSEIVSK